MKIEIPKKLKILSYYLPSLYVVGGYVRNSLLGLRGGDIDVAAEYRAEELPDALANTEFRTAGINRRLGTVKIYSREDRDFSVEYTTFRIDSYPVGSGVHTPSDVVFTKDINRDAFRRDFSANAVYYSIDSDEFTDPAGGVADIGRRVLRTTASPEKVFSEDGLRIMRMSRLAAELNFTVEEETFAAAKKMSGLLRDISAERIRDELMKILVADTKYPGPDTADAHLRGIRMLDESGALDVILPEIAEAKGMEQKPEYHVYDVFEHLVQTMYYCPPHLRLAGLLHDIGKPASVKKTGKMHLHSDLGTQMARKILGRNGLRMSNREIDTVCALIGAHMYDLDGLTSERKLRLFIADNRQIVEDVIALKRADAKASAGDPEAQSVSADRMERLRAEMLRDGTPMSVAELEINGKDLEKTSVPAEKRGWALRKVFEHVVAHPDCRTREAQLAYLHGLNYGSTGRN